MTLVHNAMSAIFPLLIAAHSKLTRVAFSPFQQLTDHFVLSRRRNPNSIELIFILMHGIIKAIIIVIAITIGHHLLPANLQRLPKHCWVMEVVSTVIHSLMVVHFLNSRVKCVRLPISARTV